MITFQRLSAGILLALSLTTSVSAATENERTDMPDRYQVGSQYLAYPRPAYGMPKLTEAPKDYVPFHIEHYGRHGSRWLLKDADYDRPVEALEKAKANGKLTPRGEQLLGQLSKIAADSKGRVGELTPLGHRQHRDIARRMTENFPEIFVPGTHVDAKSTVIIRCILSMANEIAELQRICPELIVTCDASRTTQKILAYNSTDSVAKKLGREAEKKYEPLFDEKYSDHSVFISKIFNDPQFVADSLDEKKIFTDIFEITTNAQSHDDQPDLYDIFTTEELNNEWKAQNAGWYLSAGNTSITNNRIPYNQRVLLRNIIESADTAMVSPRLSANLRFGHESIVLPLTILMELDGNDFDTTDIENLPAHWRNYEIFPMGSNIQIIFYRPAENPSLSPDDVLVKVLLNEKEVTLPLDPVSGPYYKWSDMRDLYMSKLDAFPTKFTE
ncbi:MAG: histidine-type phosphatase [Duncaniella sp.]|uniref:histidine-type phosphatase n=1 Tax=Duncaniella sp. TaxID=2518496 RepID=UPI0023BC7E01|nr:histidine-type phosphatase [Duncaniella sp.]MDE6090147.1 histidine-type phosphatase [Duncaniella sp.]